MSKVPEKVKTAIELAKGPGICEYIDVQGNACCVIAQLGKLHGIDPKKWAINHNVVSSTNVSLINQLPYPSPTLDRLQIFWDSEYTAMSESPNKDLLEFAETLDW